MVAIDGIDVKAMYFADKHNTPTMLYVERERQQVNPDGYVQLQCLPSENGKLIVTEINEGTQNIDLEETKTGITSDNQYEVYDRENGILRFSKAKAGKEFLISYMAVGRIMYSADRIFTNTDTEGNVIEVLGDIIRNCERIIANVGTLGDAKVIIEQTQTNIDSLKNLNLDFKLTEGNALKIKLDNTINAGKQINETITSSNNIANKTKAKLDEWVIEHEDIINLDNRVENSEVRITKINEQLNNMKNNIVYAKEFGVKADGINDDTIALQNAINSLRPKVTNDLWGYQNCGGTVILPKGTIRITDTIRLYSNIKIIGTNKTLFGRISDDTLLLLDTNDKTKQAISFVGLDPATNTHINKLFITGEEMDDGSVTQTFNVTLESFTIKSKNGNDLAINLSGAVKSKINDISFNNFDVDIFASANWDNEMNNCNTLCNFSHMILVGGNSLLVNSIYINPTESPKNNLSNMHILYPYVNNTNLVYKNTQTGIINIGLHGLNIEKPIIEKVKIGVQICCDKNDVEKFYNNCSINKIHMEHIEKAFVFKNVACLINGVYAYITPRTSEYLIEGYNSHITGINIQPIKYIKLFKEDIDGSYNFFGCVDEWITNTNISKGTIGETIFEYYNDQAIRKTWQSQVKELIGDTTVELQYSDLKDVKTCAINTSKLVVTSPPESPLDVRYSNTVILNCPTVKTIYSFNARDFQEFTLIALNNNISLNGRDSEGKLIIKNEIVDPIPLGGVIKFICYNGVCYEISRSF